VEYNARFGDPETQVVLPLLETDLLEIMLAACDGKLGSLNVKWSDKKAVCVVMASGGYPGSYEKGKEITGIADAEKDGALVYHAGTSIKDGKLVTSGGRVLGVTALADSFENAIKKAYEGVEKINFDGAFSRSDIGARVL
jgi:phosphoribosylamine--glycine ligase